jgi:hypothetical protein
MRPDFSKIDDRIVGVRFVSEPVPGGPKYIQQQTFREFLDYLLGESLVAKAETREDVYMMLKRMHVALSQKTEDCPDPSNIDEKLRNTWMQLQRVSSALSLVLIEKNYMRDHPYPSIELSRDFRPYDEYDEAYLQ